MRADAPEAAVPEAVGSGQRWGESPKAGGRIGHSTHWPIVLCPSTIHAAHPMLDGRDSFAPPPQDRTLTAIS